MSNAGIPVGKAPNRVLDLAELNCRFFRNVNEQMQRLLNAHPEFYLHPSKQWEYAWAMQQADPGVEDSLLDAGCGASIFPLYLASRGFHVTACDIDLRGDRSYEGVRYVPASISELPFTDGAFDAIFCISVIEHLPHEDMCTAMHEFRRVLKPGGSVLLTTDFYEDANAEIWYEGPDRWFKVDWNFFDERSLKRFLLKTDGFRVCGDIDMEVDWAVTKPTMRRFHGYPYTSIGIKLLRTD